LAYVTPNVTRNST